MDGVTSAWKAAIWTSMRRLFAGFFTRPRPLAGRWALSSIVLGASALSVSCSAPPSDGVGLGTAGAGVTPDPGPAGNAGAAAGSPAASGNGGSTGNAGGATGNGSAGSAGNASSAGSSGAGNGAAGAFAGVSGALCPDSAVFCDDFETDTVGQVPGAPWRASVNGGTVNVDSTRAFSGANAVLARAPLGAAYRRAYFAVDAASFPGATLEMYGRAMMYLDQISNADSHWTFVQGEGRSADNTHNALYRYGGQHENGAQLMANYETTDGVATDCWDHSASKLSAGAWSCVEWRFVVATNEMQFWLNGTELSDIHVTGMGEGCGGNALNGQWTAPPDFDTLYLGWEHYQVAANDINLWVDDVAVSTERVGCPAPQ
jgi:polysaccharide lyase-like protein